MRVPLDWLAEWVDLPASLEELCHKLTFAGLEVADLEEGGAEIEGVVVGEVVGCGRHPRADRLSLCRVEIGGGEPLEVVCGAPNVAQGQKVAFAPVGTVLADGTKLKKARIRGVSSHGMICSERELGISDEHEGILVLDSGAPVGVALGEVLGRGGAVLDLEITPNRGDWASLLGVAREVRAHFPGELRIPPSDPEERGAQAREEIAIEIEDREGCHRYLGRIVRGVSVVPSPEWLARKLLAAGLRPINAVVDATNLVLLEFGHPLHAFDLRELRERRVLVRRARAGEKLATLDGQMRELDPQDLVIADAQRVVAIAGVMGGVETEVRDDTVDVLIECAHFHPTSVRRTARRLGLHTDASYRFERGVDHAGLQRAIDRAALLIAELCSGAVAPGVVEAKGKPFSHRGEVELDPEHPNRLLGTDLSREDVISCLARIEVEACPGANGKLRCSVPSYRNDLEIPEDLVEEVARVWGYERIPETLPQGTLEGPAEPPAHALCHRVRGSLAASGWNEARTAPFAAESDADALLLASDDSRRQAPRIANPLQEELPLLRTTLIPSLLRAVRYNLSHQVEQVRLFEVAAQFRPGAAGELPEEPIWVAGVVAAGGDRGLWQAEAPIFFEAKGALERLASDLGQELGFRPGSPEPYLHPGAAAELRLGKTRVGAIGELHPRVAGGFEIDAPCALFELNLEALLASPAPTSAFREVSRQPAVRRDIAVLVDRDTPAGEVLAAIRGTGGPLLASVELFDRYEGAGIPESKVSLAFRLVLQRFDRTLTESEISKATERVRKMLVHKFGGELR